jgi:hypothetical protein
MRRVVMMSAMKSMRGEMSLQFPWVWREFVVALSF